MWLSVPCWKLPHRLMGFLPVVSFLDQGSFHGWPGKPALRAPRVYLGKETDLCPNKLVLGQPCPRPEFVCIRDCVSRGEIGVGGATHPLGEASVSQSLVGPPPRALPLQLWNLGDREWEGAQKLCSPPQQPPSKRWERALPSNS